MITLCLILLRPPHVSVQADLPTMPTTIPFAAQKAPSASAEKQSCLHRFFHPCAPHADTHSMEHSFEGGTRVVAFATGGYLPEKMQGKTVNGLMHTADWYILFSAFILRTDRRRTTAAAPLQNRRPILLLPLPCQSRYATFASLAGQAWQNDAKATAANLPPVESLDMWPMISGANETSPRTELALSGGPVGQSGLISGQYKLLRGELSSAFFPGPHMPNSSDTGSKVRVTLQKRCDACSSQS